MRSKVFTRPRNVAATVLACLALFALPAGAAAEDQVVSIFACANPDIGNGQATVDAGEPVGVHWGWQALRRGMVVSAVKAIEQTVTLDGTPIADVDSYWSAPFTVEVEPYGTIWQADWVYDAGSLETGETLDVTLEFYYTHPVFDGVSPIFPYPGPDAPVYVECQITAV